VILFLSFARVIYEFLFVAISYARALSIYQPRESHVI
jgi:hypothetical protein